MVREFNGKLAVENLLKINVHLAINYKNNKNFVYPQY